MKTSRLNDSEMRSTTFGWLLVVIFIFQLGCTEADERKHRILVSPVIEELPATYQGKIGLVWGGDEMEIHVGGVIHFVRLVGVMCPEAGQPFHAQSRNMVRKQFKGKLVTVDVVRQDEYKCEYARVVTEDGKDLTLELIQSGLGWYDLSQCESADIYQEAQTKARENQVGLWKETNPIAPWDFRESELQKMKDHLQESVPENGHVD